MPCDIATAHDECSPEACDAARWGVIETGQPAVARPTGAGGPGRREQEGEICTGYTWGSLFPEDPSWCHCRDRRGIRRPHRALETTAEVVFSSLCSCPVCQSASCALTATIAQGAPTKCSAAECQHPDILLCLIFCYWLTTTAPLRSSYLLG